MSAVFVAVIGVLTIAFLPMQVAVPVFICGAAVAGWASWDRHANTATDETRDALERTRTVLGELDDHGPTSNSTP
jgi:hypothetical protein